MLYLMILIVAMIIGLLRGGELNSLYRISIEGVSLFAAALILRISIWFVEYTKLSFFFPYVTIIIMISYFLLIFASIKNMKLPGFKYITLGILLNSFVILANQGKMPVLINQGLAQHINPNTLMENSRSMIHYLKNGGTLFAFLGDVLPLPNPFPENAILSVGDILIFVGILIFVQKTMLREKGQKPETIE